ncbi:MAG: pyrimidine-nucleoside phosphorylase, partial [Christensenellales bacterium]
MNILDIIEVKKRGGELTDAQIDQFIDATIDPATPDYQLAALLMAIRINGMTDRETVRLTIDMEHSGDTLDLNAIDGIPVDKHSTGGVGDTTTLILAPLIAACGAPDAKMSGRGLG